MNTIWSQFLVLEYEDPKPASSLPPETPRNASFWVFFHGEALMTSIRLAHTVLQHFFYVNRYKEKNDQDYFLNQNIRRRLFKEVKEEGGNEAG